jgi:hypothetical protein
MNIENVIGDFSCNQSMVSESKVCTPSGAAQSSRFEGLTVACSFGAAQSSMAVKREYPIAAAMLEEG